MKNVYEMKITEYYKFSLGQIALVGFIEPKLDRVIMGCKAFLYADNTQLCSINIIGEDRFVRVEGASDDRRAIRTDDDIYDLLQSSTKKSLRIVFDFNAYDA